MWLFITAINRNQARINAMYYTNPIQVQRMWHKRLQTRASEELRFELAEASKEQHCSQSEMVRTAITSHLRHLATIKELRQRHQNNAGVVYPPVKQ